MAAGCRCGWAVLAITIGATIGIITGLLAGYYGGWLDAGSSWLTDVLLSFPDILLALAIIAVLGPGIANAMVAIGIAFIPAFVRVTRSNVLGLREMDYVEAARAIGVRDSQIILRHILPNAMRTLLVLLTLGIGSAILAGAALSFLGLGAQPPTPEWGAMLNAGQKYIRQAWWITVFPGLGIFLTVLAINLIGDAIGDAVAGTDASAAAQGDLTGRSGQLKEPVHAAGSSLQPVRHAHRSGLPSQPARVRQG